ncbi:MAG: prepilin-type N-terminal cleavage/methylation domain-containing protein [Oceanicoccus sp.]|jgi:prepilin-type N-terminal cleavage/methylation domain-containing protein
MQLPKLRKGFTLIELLIVITIIGVLAVALVPRIVGAPAKARDAARLADLQQIATGLELYYDSQGAYPTTGSCVTDIATDLTGSYLTSVPEDPATKPGSTSCTGYAYEVTSDGFFLMAQLETHTIKNSAKSVYGTQAMNSTATSASQSPTATCTGASGDECYYYVIR